MSLSEQNLEHGFQFDLDDPKTSYMASDVQMRYLQDINNSSLYAGGQIRFSSVSLFGSSPDVAVSLRNGILAIPVSTVMVTTGVFGTHAGNAGAGAGSLPASNVAQTQGYSLALKSPLHIINSSIVKLNGVQLTRGLDYQNLVAQERWKTYTQDEQRVLGERFAHHWDSFESYQCTPAAADTVNNTNNVEYNNTTAATPMNGVFGLSAAANCVNAGMLKKMQFTNAPLNQDTHGMMYNDNDALTVQTYHSHFAGVNVADESYDGVVYRPGQVARWNTYVVLRLGEICDFFNQAPVVNACSSLEISIQTNLDPQNSYSITCTYPFNGRNIGAAIAGGPVFATNVIPTANVSSGRCCPYQIAMPMASLGCDERSTGLHLLPPGDSTSVRCTVSSKIGHWGPSISGHRCRIWIPVIRYNPLYLKTLLSKQGTKVVRYTDHLYDQIENITPGAQISKMLSFNLSKVRKLYVYPYIRRVSGGPQPMHQLTSSAPTTVSPALFTDWQVQIASNNIYSEPLSLDVQSYDFGPSGFMSINGLDPASREVSGQISKNMFLSGVYGVYTFDLQKVISEEADAAPKSIILRFFNRSQHAGSYNALIIATEEKSCELDISSGMIVA
jgi:hypothetical protein